MHFHAYTTTLLLQGVFAQDQVPLTKHPGLFEIPELGFGTWHLDISPENTTAAVSHAIQVGYRHIDAAKAYGNQAAVGKGIADGLLRTGLRRDQIWVTSKLFNDQHAPYTDVEDALDETLDELGLDYLDLYLMHWPVSHPTKDNFTIEYLKTWDAMTALPRTKAHHLGISNFSPIQLVRLLASHPRAPAVHQFELHPYLHQPDWLAFHRARGIAVTAYSPLGNTNPTYDAANSSLPKLLTHPVMTAVAAEVGCTPAQVAVAWGVGRGTAVVVKSAHAARIEENRGALGCGLPEFQRARIDAMEGRWQGRFNNPGKRWGVKLFEGLFGADGEERNE